jgi:hypothetical protein
LQLTTQLVHLVVPNGGGVGITGDLQVQGPSTFAGNIVCRQYFAEWKHKRTSWRRHSAIPVYFLATPAVLVHLYAGVSSTYTALPTTVVLQLAAVI